MFCVSEDEATAIRTVFEQDGELSASIELRRMFPGVTDGMQARDMVRMIAGWKPVAIAQLPSKRKRAGH